MQSSLGWDPLKTWKINKTKAHHHYFVVNDNMLLFCYRLTGKPGRIFSAIEILVITQTP
jgi:hypothetical protein